MASPRGLGEVGGVPGLLQGADVVGDVLVLLGELVDAALPGAGVLGQVAERDADLEQVLELADQRQRGLGARRLGDVVGDRRPVGDRGDVEPHARVLEDPDDAGGALVRRLLELEPVDQLGLGGGAVTGIGRVCGVSASSAPRVTTSSPPSSSQAASSSAQNCRQRMLGSMPRIRITSRSRSGGEATAICVRRPGDPAVAVLVGADDRPVDLEVVEVLGVDGADDPRRPTPRSGGRPPTTRRPRRRSSPRRRRSPRGRPGRASSSISITPPA